MTQNTARKLLAGALGIALGHAAHVQGQSPGTPEENGLNPISETIYINTLDTINNVTKATESIGIAITRSGNVIVGWENDGDGVTDLEAVWTLFDRNGNPLTPDTEQVSKNPDFAEKKVTSRFLSYFDGTNAIPGWTSWGPKIKANLFGDGMGMGATSFGLGLEVPAFASIQANAAGENAGDFPGVQLLDNNGQPIRIVSGASDEYAERDGDIRIGDWDYLSNGNIAIVGESRQRADLVDIFGGTEAKTHGIVRIVDPTGKEVKAAQLVSDSKTESQIWHGVGAVRGAFGVRFQGTDGRAVVRLFDNAGTPISTNIDLGTLGGNEIMATGGRGDSVGFHGNGNDLFAAVAAGTDTDGKKQVWVTVFGTNRVARWSRAVSDDLTLENPSRCDVAIDSLGRVAVAYADTAASGSDKRLVLGRVFDSTGKPLGKTFLVSEKELPATATDNSKDPRVAFRNDIVAFTWVSRNLELPGEAVAGAGVVAARFFVVPVKPGSIESVGLTRIVPDRPVINQSLDSLGNWEPYASVLGTNIFLIQGNAFAQDTTDKQRYVVALQPAAGGAMKLAEGFYGDDGKPFAGEINASRQNGNPGRVAGDTRPGAVNYMVGGEASPHVYAPFSPSTRWSGFDRLVDGRYGTVQTYKLDAGSLTPTPLHNALDSANGRETSGTAPGNQITRFGGDIVCLDNGNFVSVVEDRSNVRNAGNAAVATIFSPDGKVVKESFLVAPGDFWSNVAAVKGGFVVRVLGVLYFYDNAGVLQGQGVNQSTSGEQYDDTRGDGTRIAGHINHPYVVLAGKVKNAPVVRVSAWDARTREFVATAEVSEGGFRGDFNRAIVAVDALKRMTVCWVSKPDGYEQDQVAARLLVLDDAAKTIRPLTSSFFAFVNAAPVGGIRTLQMSVAMTTRQVMVAAKGEINLANKPEQGADSPRELNFFTVFSHADPQPDPTPAVGGVATGSIRISSIRSQGANVVVEWTGGTGPFKVQKRASLSGGDWSDATTTSERSATLPRDGAAGFFRISQ